MYNPNNPNSAFGPNRRGPLAFCAMVCIMFGVFCFFPGMFMTIFGGSSGSFGGTQVVGVIFFLLGIGLTCTGIFLCIRVKKEHDEYIQQTAGTQQQQMPVITGLPPPGSYGTGNTQSVQPPQAYNTASGTNGTPYPPQAYSASSATDGTPYPPATSAPYTSGTPYPPQSEASDPDKAPPPSYESAVMGVQPSAPSADEKSGM